MGLVLRCTAFCIWNSVTTDLTGIPVSRLDSSASEPALGAERHLSLGPKRSG